jgi:hypothetical protein
MNEKIKFFEVVVLAADNYVFPPQSKHKDSRQMKVMIPAKAISYITPVRDWDERSNYYVHFQKQYLDSLPFPIKSYSSPILQWEDVEILEYC